VSYAIPFTILSSLSNSSLQHMISRLTVSYLGKGIAIVIHSNDDTSLRGCNARTSDHKLKLVMVIATQDNAAVLICSHL
jgi:hypothetical protein